MYRVYAFRTSFEAETMVNLLNEFKIPYENNFRTHINEFIDTEFIIQHAEQYLDTLQFIDYLCNNYLKSIEHLETCYKQELIQCA